MALEYFETVPLGELHCHCPCRRSCYRCRWRRGIGSSALELVSKQRESRTALHPILSTTHLQGFFCNFACIYLDTSYHQWKLRQWEPLLPHHVHDTIFDFNCFEQ
jgi:hypothetical protein